MANAARKSVSKNVVKIQGDWLCRDISSWRVRVPCVGGSGRFLFSEYGGSEKALKAAKAFQRKALKLLKEDREYAAKHGEVPYRETVYITNKSGVRGVCRIVAPTQSGTPLISWVAQWPGRNGRTHSATFSTHQYKTEAEAKAAAIKKRKEMIAHVLLPTN